MIQPRRSPPWRGFFASATSPETAEVFSFPSSTEARTKSPRSSVSNGQVLRPIGQSIRVGKWPIPMQPEDTRHRISQFNDNRSTERRARNTLTAPALRPLRGVSASGSDRPSKNRGAGLTNRRLSPFNDLCVVQAAHQRHRRVFACVNPGQGSPFNEDRCVEIRHALASKRRKGTRVCRREGMPEGSLAGAVSGSQVHRAMYAGVMSGRSSPFMAKARCAVECSVRFRASATEATQTQTCKA